MFDKIRVSGIANDSIVDGVGLRYTLFVQGCPLQCEGCHNPKTQSFEGGKFYTAEEIFAQIDKNPLLDGVTFSGGEPICQASNLLSLAKMIKKKGLHLAMYTGFVFENLISKNAPQDAKQLLELVDIVIDGPFVLALKDVNLRFKGSSNQRIINVYESLKQNKTVLEMDENWN